LIKLPHPYLTVYRISEDSDKFGLELQDQPATGQAPSEVLHHQGLRWHAFTTKKDSELPLPKDNSAWARACRSPQTTFEWAEDTATPSIAMIWNLCHAIFVACPTHEYFRLVLQGGEPNLIRHELLCTGLAIEHPRPWHSEIVTPFTEELLILRSAFWQGAASPFGPRPVWVVGVNTDGPLRKPLKDFPPMPEAYQLTMKFPREAVYARHPVRRPKPHPGSIVYSRYIPEVEEHFSLEAVDWTNADHLRLFNQWQNDPRVAKGWNETGTLEQHQSYLRNLHFDPHVLCLFGRFDDKRFAYFELYWAKEDHYGAHYAAADYDRGRHSLVGDESLRGAHRVNAWYSSCIHYLFLDDIRMSHVVGEPKATGGTILSYENAQGLTIGSYVDLGHKRSVHSICSREKWFQLCPIFWDGRKKPLESADRAAWNAKL
jgi:hypothetical protein